MKHRSAHRIRTVLALAVILAMVLSVSGCDWSIKIDWYTEMESIDWAKLPYYTGVAGESLGYIPSRWLGEVYRMDGVPTNELLFARTWWFTGGPETEEVFWNTATEEPARNLPFTKLTVDLSGGDQVVVDDPAVMTQLTELLKTEGQRIEWHELERNTHISFGLPCQLTFDCELRKNEAGGLTLTAYWMKERGIYTYDVTDILQGSVNPDALA